MWLFWSIASIYSYILVLCLEFDVLQKEDGTGGWEEERHPYEKHLLPEVSPISFLMFIFDNLIMYKIKYDHISCHSHPHPPPSPQYPIEIHLWTSCLFNFLCYSKWRLEHLDYKNTFVQRSTTVLNSQVHLCIKEVFIQTIDGTPAKSIFLYFMSLLWSHLQLRNMCYKTFGLIFTYVLYITENRRNYWKIRWLALNDAYFSLFCRTFIVVDQLLYSHAIRSWFLL